MAAPLAETSCHKALGNRCAHCHRMPLTQRARGVFDTMFHVDFGVPRRDAPPLAERLQIVHCIKTRHRQHAIQHRGHVPGIQEETVPIDPLRVFRIIYQKLGIQHIGKIGTTHGSAGVSRFGLFNHCCRQYSYIVSGSVQQVRIVHGIFFTKIIQFASINLQKRPKVLKKKKRAGPQPHSLFSIYLYDRQIVDYSVGISVLTFLQPIRP